jgi:anti-sigma factor RsiW
MMTPERPIGEQELHAYVDGQLEPDLRAAVERHLGANPDVAQRVAADIAHRDALRAAFTAHSAEPLPPELNLSRLIEARLRQRHAPWRIAATIVLSIGVGGAGGWLLHSLPVQDGTAGVMSRLQTEALASHMVYAVDRRHPIEVAAAEREHLTQWLSNRLNRTVAPPDLSDSGYKLIGGRLLATEQGGAAALFMYEDEHGNRLSLTMRPVAADLHAPIVDWDRNEVNACSWIDKGIGYALLGAVPDDKLDAIARQIAGQRG